MLFNDNDVHSFLSCVRGRARVHHNIRNKVLRVGDFDDIPQQNRIYCDSKDDDLFWEF